MGVLISEVDFVGRWELTLPTFAEKRNALIGTIDIYEREELVKLMGTDMYNDFVLNRPTYSALENPIIEGGGRRSHYSDSLKHTILSFVYLRIAKQGYVIPSENGRMNVNMENGALLNPYVRDIDMYNKAVDAWKAIQIYSRKHYNLFKGIDKTYKFY